MPGSNRVLLVSGQESLPPVLHKTLADKGGEITGVETAADALDQLRESSFGLALIDLASAGDDIERLIRQLREADGSMPIIILCGPGEEEELDAAWAAGADDFLTLPIRPSDLKGRFERRRSFRAALEELRRREDHGRLLLELTRTLSSSLDFADILYIVARRIADVVQVDRCSIVLVGNRTTGHVVASSEDPEVRNLTIDLDNYPEVQQVLNDGRALVIDVGSDPLLDTVRDRIPSDGPTTNALFPITHEGRPMGVLFLRLKKRREELTERELDVCQAVANAMAISLRNARIVSALRDERERISHERSEAQRKVEALSYYADFFESSADGMLVVDPSGAVLYANPMISSLTGRSIGELCTENLADLVATEDEPSVEKLLKEFSRGAHPTGLDLRFVGSDGQVLTLSVSASSTLRLPRGVLLILRDVTAARAMETQLRQTTEFLEGLIAQSVDAIISADMTGRLLLFNPAAERILGYEAEEVLGKPVIESLYPRGMARHIMRMLRSEKWGGVGRLRQTKATIVARDGTEVPISMTAGMIFDGEVPRATFGIFTDLRPMLEIENDLARTRLELMEREREAIAAQLAGAAAHELNQPLTFVMASMELLRRRLEQMPEDCNDVVSTILSETDRMAKIVRKIGRITHYETKEYVGSTQILDLDAAAEPSNELALAEELASFAEEKEDTEVGLRPDFRQGAEAGENQDSDDEPASDRPPSRATEPAPPDDAGEAEDSTAPEGGEGEEEER